MAWIKIIAGEDYLLQAQYDKHIVCEDKETGKPSGQHLWGVINKVTGDKTNIYVPPFVSPKIAAFNKQTFLMRKVSDEEWEVGPPGAATGNHLSASPDGVGEGSPLPDPIPEAPVQRQVPYPSSTNVDVGLAQRCLGSACNVVINHDAFKGGTPDDVEKIVIGLAGTFLKSCENGHRPPAKQTDYVQEIVKLFKPENDDDFVNVQIEINSVIGDHGERADMVILQKKTIPELIEELSRLNKDLQRKIFEICGDGRVPF